MRLLTIIFLILSKLTARAESYQSLSFDAAHMGQAIGYLNIRTETDQVEKNGEKFIKVGTASCTGFLDHYENFITNNHCIETQADCDNAMVTFVKQNGEVEARYACKQLIATSPKDSGLDVSVLKLDGDLWAQERLRYSSTLSMREINDGIDVYIAKFNFATITDGEIRPSLDIVSCFAKLDPERKDFWRMASEHNDRPCAVKGGNSGAPILNSNGEIIGVLSQGKGKVVIVQLNRHVMPESYGPHLLALKMFFDLKGMR